MPQCLSAMRSWNTHALITRAALSTVNGPRLDDSIPVVALEAFLSIAKDPLRDVLKWYYELLDRKVQGAAAKRGAILRDSQRDSHGWGLPGRAEVECELPSSIR